MPPESTPFITLDALLDRQRDPSPRSGLRVSARAGDRAAAFLRARVIVERCGRDIDRSGKIIGSPNFRRIFSAKNAREMQVGLRLAF